jgi:hypothetical protein
MGETLEYLEHNAGADMIDADSMAARFYESERRRFRFPLCKSYQNEKLPPKWRGKRESVHAAGE